jgi:ribonuclease HII
MPFSPLSQLPHLDIERQLQKSGISHICGVDEAGRGPLAGPVVAAAVILPHTKVPSGLNDSKRLSAPAREHLLNEIMTHCAVGIGIAEPEEIDRMNILAASLTAMSRAVQALPMAAEHALVDGNQAAPLRCPQTTLIKGDTLSQSIAAASIIAKVTRDRLMAQADTRFPGYGFAAHKGYATKAHRQALIDKGPCPIHRRSFAPVKAAYLAR